MALLPTKANTEGNNETMSERSPVPAGEYLAQVTKEEFKKTKSGDGHRLVLTWMITEGQYTGRIMWTGLNLHNPNQQTQDIANKELNSICEAMGLEDVEDSEELLNIPVCLTVTVDPGNDQWPPSNNITAYANQDEYGGEETEEVEVVEFEEEKAEAKEDPAPEPEVEEESEGLPWET